MKKLFLLSLVIIALSFTNAFQLKIIKGKVLDELGKPITGVTIQLKGFKIFTSTDKNGMFEIRIPNKIAQPVLQFTSVGFNVKEVIINDQNFVSVSLSADTSKLDEVVVNGYSNSKMKRSYTGSAVSVKLQSYTPTFYNQQLQGKAAGIQIANGNSQTNLPSIKNDGGDTYRNNKGIYDSLNFDREGYDEITENSFLKVSDNPLSTFSIDVDAASYSNIRRILNDGNLPEAGAVRIEEMINYFKYEYPQPKNNQPFSINTAQAACPWNNKHSLALIGLQGKKIDYEKLPASNLTFLIDVSGSMSDDNKLPLVIESLKLLTNQLREQDKVSIVVYAGNAGLVLPSTKGTEKQKIIDALSKLEAGGSTAGGQGIELAYKTNLDNLIENGNNRVILCTDGDFNVGISSDDALVRLIEEKRKLGVYLSILGYGMGNYQDAKMQKLANKGNGNHAYIDNINEAKKVLVNEFGATLFTIAKDVKLQIEFNPSIVKGYRLIGYENRMLAKEDFNDDKKDAGELGSGHTVTALYEIIPVDVAFEELDTIKVDPLKYQKVNNKIVFSNSNELMNIKFRYKKPNEETSQLMEEAVAYKPLKSIETNSNIQFAAAVAQFGLMLRNSKYKANSSYENILKLANNVLKEDNDEYKKEFINLVKKAKKLSSNQAFEANED
jgi:Ca-activated chloride channel family protein